MTDYLIIVQRLDAPGEPPVMCERRESEEVLAAMIRGTVEWRSDRDDTWGDAQMKVAVRTYPYYVEVGKDGKSRCVARVSADHETSEAVAGVLCRQLGADSSRIIRVDMVTPARSDRFEDELSEGIRPLESWADHEPDSSPQPGLPDVIYAALREVGTNTTATRGVGG
jgi:hypothetical protein